MTKYIYYFWYLLRHKYYVFKGCLLQAHLSNCLFDKVRLICYAFTHDISKFRPSEIIAYSKYFYGDDKKHISTDDRFKEAWNHHSKRNKHHWQYWVLIEDNGNIQPISMPLVYIREMVADWYGAGKAQNSSTNPKEWYLDNKDKIFLHPFTEYKLLGVLDQLR